MLCIFVLCILQLSVERGPQTCSGSQLSAPKNSTTQADCKNALCGHLADIIVVHVVLVLCYIC